VAFEALALEAPSPISPDDVLTVVAHFDSMAAVLAEADQTDRARFYEALGVTATYDPATRTAELVAHQRLSREPVDVGPWVRLRGVASLAPGERVLVGPVRRGRVRVGGVGS
jgi:hypothetical protein